MVGRETASEASIGIAALASNASVQSVGEKTGVNSVLGVAPTTADFFKEAALSDMTEIATSKLAQEPGDADAKTFAGQMINPVERVGRPATASGDAFGREDKSFSGDGPAAGFRSIRQNSLACSRRHQTMNSCHTLPSSTSAKPIPRLV